MNNIKLKCFRFVLAYTSLTALKRSWRRYFLDTYHVIYTLTQKLLNNVIRKTNNEKFNIHHKIKKEKIMYLEVCTIQQYI